MSAQTVFGQPTAGVPSNVQQDTGSYTMGMEFILSSDAPLTGVWFYSAPDAVSLPDGCAIYEITGSGTGTLVAGTSVSSPSWSGAVGSGWVKHTYDGSITLTAGVHYKAVILNNDGNWFYSATPHYWDTGAGSGGVVSGIITAVNNASADVGQDTFLNDPLLGYPTTAFNATNYWIDVEVTTSTSSPVITTPALSPAVENQAYLDTVEVSGGQTPYTLDVSIGSLPSWATLNSSTGDITGTAPEFTESTTFTVRVTDAISQTFTRQFTLVVGNPPVGYPSGGPWVTVFNEDFDNPVNGKPDPAIWASHLIEGDGLRTNTGGTEVEWYPHNNAGLSVADSILSLIARYESPYDPASVGYDPLAPSPLPGGQVGQVTSGMIQSHPGFQYTYGYTEAKCRLPMQPFTWPAFWMYAADAAWPPEIDMFEQIDVAEQFTQTYHTEANTQQTNNYSTVGLHLEDWHTYGVMWSPTAITFYFDGVETFSVDTATYPDTSLPMHLVLNLAVQNGLTGVGFPCQMDVEYVRAWVTDGVPIKPVITSISPPDGVPVDGTLTVTFDAVSGATSYRATPCPVDSDAQGTPNSRRAATGVSSPLVISDLTNGANYTVSLSAINATGYSIESDLIPSLAEPNVVEPTLLLSNFP